ncbi:MAG TPA: hypothetical protein DIV41_06760 [Ruminococcaceae bacterium]|nr:hypothetical protein [Oscillospiraceae bacterium]
MGLKNKGRHIYGFYPLIVFNYNMLYKCVQGCKCILNINNTLIVPMYGGHLTGANVKNKIPVPHLSQNGYSGNTHPVIVT